MSEVERSVVGVAVALQAHREGLLTTERLAAVLAHFDDSAAPAEPVDAVLVRLGGLRLDQVERALKGSGVPTADGRPREFTSRLTILETLGRGAMGVVYKAFDRILKRVVAIKLVGQAASPERRRVLLARFEREAQVLARVRHPAVVPVFDVGVDREGCPYLVMDFVDGRPLSDLAEERPGGLDVGRVLRWGATLADGLQACHAVGVTHRDVKPSNIMIDADDRPYLVDFGVARDADSDARITADEAMVGTIVYMAPEQALGGKDVGPPADLWGLGATLFDVLAGRPPFEGGHSLVILDAILRGPKPDLRAVRPDVPAPVAAVIARCLERDLADRFPSAAALADALRLATGPARRRMRRTRLATPAVAGVVIATIGMVFGGVGWLRGGAVAHRPAYPSPVAAPSPPAQINAPEAPHTSPLVLLDPGHAQSVRGDLHLVWVPPGRATLGAPSGVALDVVDRAAREQRFEHGFWIGEKEVSRGEYRMFCKESGRTDTGTEDTELPVVMVSWRDAAEFCAWLGGRLPTSDEWEYAARGGDGRSWPWGITWRAGVPVANVADAALARTLPDHSPIPVNRRLDDGHAGPSPVGSFPLGASPFGCLDMAGNVLEWVQDPAPDGGHFECGGCYEFTDWGARPWARFQHTRQGEAHRLIGFRPVLDAPGPR